MNEDVRMVGMTHHDEIKSCKIDSTKMHCVRRPSSQSRGAGRSYKLLVHLLLLALVGAGGIGSTNGFSQDDQSSSPGTDDALVFNISKDHFGKITDFIHSDILPERIEGHIEGPITSWNWFGTLGVEDLRYSFGVRRLRFSTFGRFVRVTAQITDLELSAGKIYHGRKGKRYCTDVSLDTGGEPIMVAANFYGRVWRQKVKLSSRSLDLEFGADGLEIARPANCQGLGPLNGVAERLLPWLGRKAEGAVESATEDLLADVMRSFTAELNTYLTADVTLPFAPTPLGAFNGRLSIWPSSLDVTHSSVRFGLGADIGIDADPIDLEGLEEVQLESGDDHHKEETFIGLSQAVLKDLLREAHREGLWQARLSRKVMPRYQMLFDKKAISRLLPSLYLTDRLTDTPVVQVRQLGSIEASFYTPPLQLGDLVATGVAGIIAPRIRLTMNDLVLEIALRSGETLRFLTDMALEYRLQLNVEGYRRLELIPSFIDLSRSRSELVGNYKKRSDVRPVPIDQDQLQALKAGLNIHLLVKPKPVFAIPLPDLPFGPDVLRFAKVDWREGYLRLVMELLPQADLADQGLETLRTSEVSDEEDVPNQAQEAQTLILSKDSIAVDRGQSSDD